MKPPDSRRVTQAAKLLLVIAAITIVLLSIQWRDQARLIGTDGDVLQTLDGHIVGAWDAQVTTFRTDTEPGAMNGATIRSDMQSDQGRYEFTPGVFTYIRNLKITPMVLGMVLFVIGHSVAALRWRWVLRVSAVNVTLSQAMRLTWIGIFFNNVVPGQTGGDVVKAIMIARRARHVKVKAALSVLLDRILGLISLACLAALAVLFAVDRFAVIAISVWAIVAIALCACLTLIYLARRQPSQLLRLLDRLPPTARETTRQIGQSLTSFSGRYWQLAGWVLVGSLNHSLFVGTVLLFGHALGVGLPSLEYFILVPVIFILSAIPIAPAGWGVGEALFGKFFATYGSAYLSGTVDPQTAMWTRGVALSILFRLNATLWSLVGGALLLTEKSSTKQIVTDS